MRVHELTSQIFVSQVHKSIERMLMAFKRNPMGPDRVQPPSAPPVDLLPPQLHAPGAQNQGNPYAGLEPPQQYMQQGDTCTVLLRCMNNYLLFRLDIGRFELISEYMSLSC